MIRFILIKEQHRESIRELPPCHVSLTMTAAEIAIRAEQRRKNIFLFFCMQVEIRAGVPVIGVYMCLTRFTHSIVVFPFNSN